MSEDAKKTTLSKAASATSLDAARAEGNRDGFLTLGEAEDKVRQTISKARERE